MFGSIQPTPLDLYFSVLGVPVRVLPTFWLGGCFFGWWMIAAERFDLLGIWLACLFLSILVHEMGHALVARTYDWQPRVFLYHFGGLAAYEPWHGDTTGRAVFLSFAGPGAGFILYGIVRGIEYGLIVSQTAVGPYAVAALAFLKEVNLWWGLFNLLPVLPLDGGRICEELCRRYVRRRDGREVALMIGIGVGAVAAGIFFSQREQYAGLLFAVLALQNFQMYQAYRGGGGW